MTISMKATRLVAINKAELLEEEKAAKKLILESKMYETFGVLDYEHPTELIQLLQKHHGGRFAGHFAERKLHSTLWQQ